MFGGTNAHRLPVDVAPDRRNGGEFLELVEYQRRADVAGVENQVDVAKKIRNGRVKETVRVGEDAKGHVF